MEDPPLSSLPNCCWVSFPSSIFTDIPHSGQEIARGFIQFDTNAIILAIRLYFAVN